METNSFGFFGFIGFFNCGGAGGICTREWWFCRPLPWLLGYGTVRKPE